MLYPRSTEGGMGVHWIHPDVCPSLGPSVCRQGFRNFLKKLLVQFISYLAFTLMGWICSPLFISMFQASFLALWWPNIWPKMWFPELLEKTIGWINFIPGIDPNGVSILTPIHLRVPSLIFVPLVAKYLAENGGSDCQIETLLDISGWGGWWSERVYCPHSWVQLVVCRGVFPINFFHPCFLCKV